MHFESAASAWFGLALPFIVLLYLFKRRYADTPVSSHLLWSRVLKDLEANSPWQKLRNRLLMLVQLLVAALLVLALMQPWVWSERKSKGHVVVVLDRSASMTSVAAGEGGASKLDAAKQSVLEWAGRSGSGSAVTLISMGVQAEVLLSRETDRGRLRDALDGMGPVHGRTAYKESLSLASALTRSDPDAEVRLFTDGHFAESMAGVSFVAPVYVERVPGQEDTGRANVSVTQFGVKSERGAGVSAVVTVRNRGEADAQAQISIYAGTGRIESRNLTVQPGKHASLSFGGLPVSDWYKAEIDAGDPMRLDDVGYAFLAEDRPKKVLLVGYGNLFLEKALQLAGAEVTKLAPEGVSAWIGSAKEASLPDVVAIESSGQTPLDSEVWRRLTSSKPVLYIGAGYSGKERAVPFEAYTVVEHPVTRFIHLHDVHIASVLDPDSVSWGKPVVTARDVPLLYAGTENGWPRVLLTFRLDQTDLPLRSEFPVLMQNALEWLADAREGSLGKAVASEKLDVALSPRTASFRWEQVELTIPGAASAKNGQIPEGAETHHPDGMNGSADGQQAGKRLAVQAAPAEAGLYRLVEQDENGSTLRSRLLAVTADPRESAVSPELFAISDNTDSGQEPSDAGQGRQGAPLDLWRLLALLILAAMVWEWEVYRRGASV